MIFAPFNFAVLFGSRNSQNKWHTNIKGFTVVSVPTGEKIWNLKSRENGCYIWLLLGSITDSVTAKYSAVSDASKFVTIKWDNHRVNYITTTLCTSSTLAEKMTTTYSPNDTKLQWTNSEKDSSSNGKNTTLTQNNGWNAVKVASTEKLCKRNGTLSITVAKRDDMNRWNDFSIFFTSIPNPFSSSLPFPMWPIYRVCVNAENFPCNVWMAYISCTWFCCIWCVKPKTIPWGTNEHASIFFDSILSGRDLDLWPIDLVLPKIAESSVTHPNQVKLSSFNVLLWHNGLPEISAHIWSHHDLELWPFDLNI